MDQMISILEGLQDRFDVCYEAQLRLFHDLLSS